MRIFASDDITQVSEMPNFNDMHNVIVVPGSGKRPKF